MPSRGIPATFRDIGCDKSHPCLWQSLRRGALAFATLAGMLCGALIGDSLVQAQDDWDAVDKPVNQPVVNHFQLPQFDQWVYGGKNPAQIRDMLLLRAATQVDSFALTYDLSDAQRKELELAARGDVKRFFREAEEVRAKYNEFKGDQQKLNEIVQAIQPIQRRMQGSFFNSSSLLYKSVKSTLTSEQTEKYEREHGARRKFAYEAKIESALIMLERGVPLREQQRVQFVKLLLEETEAPEAFGRQVPYEVFYQAGTLEEEKLRRIFDNNQWRAIQKLLTQAKALGPNLMRNGFKP